MSNPQNPGVGHGGGNGCGPPGKGAVYQERRVNIEKLGVGGHMVILPHPFCNCNTGCRRVTLWHPRPAGIEQTDDWLVKAIARVRWGDGCGGPEVEVDWKHGVILDLSGCYDEVSLEIIEASGTVPDEDHPLTYGVLSACCGAGAARGCATRTTARTVQTTGTTELIGIPPFAYAVQFATITPALLFSATTTFAQFGSGSAGFASAVSIATGDDFPDPWMLVHGAETIGVTNASGSSVEYEVIFLIGV